MFTGIIEATADVIEKREDGLILQRPSEFDDIKIGSSICVSGVCLSIVEFDQSSMSFDVVPETFRCSKLGSLEEGDRVNLERAMKADGRFEGHVVQGHVECTTLCVSLDISSEKISNPKFQIPNGLGQYIVSKGSITIDGVSLTVASVEEDTFSIALIPHTLENTTLGSLREGDAVNIETDILVRYSLKHAAK